MEWMQKCEMVAATGNGYGRGDGHDVTVLALPSRRGLLRIEHVQSGRVSWRICPTVADAREHAARDMRAGTFPGRWRPVRDPSRLADFRG